MYVCYAVLRIRDVFPESGSRIPDLKTATKERGEKTSCRTFFCSHKFHKIEYCFIIKMLKKKIWASFHRIKEILTKQITLSSQKYGFGIRDQEKTYSGSRIQGSKRNRIPHHGSGSATLNCYVNVFSSSMFFFCQPRENVPKNS